MGKTRAEIQKAYRERKKENDTEFLTKEKERQKKYRKHVAEMTPQEKAKKRSLNKIHCKAYRLKKNVFVVILGSACLSMCPSVCLPVYKILVIACFKALAGVLSHTG